MTSRDQCAGAAAVGSDPLIWHELAKAHERLLKRMQALQETHRQHLLMSQQRALQLTEQQRKLREAQNLKKKKKKKNNKKKQEAKKKQDDKEKQDAKKKLKWVRDRK